MATSIKGCKCFPSVFRPRQKGETSLSSNNLHVYIYAMPKKCYHGDGSILYLCHQVCQNLSFGFHQISSHHSSLVLFLSILATTTLIEEYREVRRLRRRAQNKNMTTLQKRSPSLNPVISIHKGISQLQEASSSLSETQYLCNKEESYGTVKKREESEDRNREMEDVLSEESVDDEGYYEEGYFSLYDCDDKTYYKSNETPG